MSLSIIIEELSPTDSSSGYLTLPKCSAGNSFLVTNQQDRACECKGKRFKSGDHSWGVHFQTLCPIQAQPQYNSPGEVRLTASQAAVQQLHRSEVQCKHSHSAAAPEKESSLHAQPQYSPLDLWRSEAHCKPSLGPTAPQKLAVEKQRSEAHCKPSLGLTAPGKSIS